MKENKCFPPGTQVGLPAKSGVSGVMIGPLVPKHLMGYSPFSLAPLDQARHILGSSRALPFLSWG
ncbi:hypothetical protein COOONC_19036, partial [Cooperia oncophora]